MWLQRAVTVAGVGTSESGVGTSKAVHAVLSSSELYISTPLSVSITLPYQWAVKTDPKTVMDRCKPGVRQEEGH